MCKSERQPAVIIYLKGRLVKSGTAQQFTHHNVMGLEHTFATRHVTMQALHKGGNPMKIKINVSFRQTKIKALNK